MQEKHLFEYAVIRVVPMVEREEFLNVGIILYSQQTKFLECIYSLDKERLRAFNNTVDMVEVEKSPSSSIINTFFSFVLGSFVLVMITCFWLEEYKRIN